MENLTHPKEFSNTQENKENFELIRTGGAPQKPTTSQFSTSIQIVVSQNVVVEAPKPPVSVASFRSAPGMYKGKIVQSKIGSIWKSSNSLANAHPKPPAHKAKSQRSEDVARRNVSESVVMLPRSNAQKPRPKSAAGPLPLGPKPTTSNRQPLARTVTATLNDPRSRRPKGASGKATGTLNVKPNVLVVENKKAAPVSCSYYQFRLNSETAEDRRVKLAAWLASKGRTLKRPPMKLAAQATKVKVEPQLAAHETPDSTPHVQELEDIVVNLSDALDAMAPPALCTDEVKNESDVETESNKSNDDKEELREIPVKIEEEKRVKKLAKDDVESNLMSTPQMGDASVIKYSVSSTPYLQGVKKTLEEGACATGSKRLSNIKAVKYLTPVRRSCRIQRNVSSFPAMLVNQDPCVSSLAELGRLDENIYVYRKNAALPEDSLDQKND